MVFGRKQFCGLWPQAFQNHFTSIQWKELSQYMQPAIPGWLSGKGSRSDFTQIIRQMLFGTNSPNPISDSLFHVQMLYFHNYIQMVRKNQPSSIQRFGMTYCQNESFANAFLAPSSHRVYQVGCYHYKHFCHKHNFSFKSIKLYLSAIKHRNIALCFKCSIHRMAQLHMLLCGIKSINPSTSNPSTSTPLLKALSIPTQDKLMLWSACMLPFFGFLWTSEYVAPSTKTYDKAVALSQKDILIRKGTIGRSENKTLTKFSSYENEVRPGVVMTGIFSYVCRG